MPPPCLHIVRIISLPLHDGCARNHTLPLHDDARGPTPLPLPGICARTYLLPGCPCMTAVRGPPQSPPAWLPLHGGLRGTIPAPA